MKLDCKDLACPEPVLRLKKALEALGDDALLELEVNSVSSIENCKRFATNAGHEVREAKEGDTTVLTVIKGYPCDIAEAAPQKREGVAKTFFVKSRGIGEGELGSKLMAGFLKAASELDELPRNIVFVNEGVLLTTSEEHRDVIDALGALEERGVQVFSCGLCLNFLNIPPEELKVGQIGNAFDTLRMMMETDVVNL